MQLILCGQLNEYEYEYNYHLWISLTTLLYRNSCIVKSFEVEECTLIITHYTVLLIE